MKISSVGCRQFAGLRNLEPIQFSDGLNIVYGKNESGKSTLIGLIHGLLWQSGKVLKRSEFRKTYFPAAVKAGGRGNTIDGRLVIDTDDGPYTITKKWGDSGSGELEMPTALLDEFADKAEFSEQLKALLVYGEGVYREVLFASQKTMGKILENLLDGKLESDLSRAASSAMMDMGGISSKKFVDAIEEKMKGLESNWDWRIDGPEGGRGVDNQRTKNVGSILKAYYVLEENKRKFSALQSKMDAVGAADKAYAGAFAEFQSADAALGRFNQYYSLLINYQNTKRVKESAEGELRRRQAAEQEWPKAAAALEKAKALQSELNRARLMELWAELSQIQHRREQAQEKLAQLPVIDAGTLADAKELSGKIRRLENKLRAFSAMLSFNLESGYEIIITSEADGRRLPLEGSAAEISEAVRVEIPGVVTFHLSAADLDVKAVTGELEECRLRLGEILNSYGVGSYEKLDELAKDAAGAKRQLEQECAVYSRDEKRLLEGRTPGDVEADYEKVKQLPTRPSEEIRAEISAFTKDPIGTCVSLLEQKLENYRAEYRSPQENAAEIAGLTNNIRKYRQEIEQADTIPEEYRLITDPENRKKALESSQKQSAEKKERQYQSLQDARAAVKAAEEAADYIPLDELSEVIEDNAATLKQLKAEFRAWEQIKTAAEEILNEAGSNPLQTLEDDFREYLAKLSGDRVELASLGKKLDAEIYSGNNRMTYELLSEGTKDTVALAFRLAVINFLFPDGGGFVVFDDPFTDMDEERRVRACALIQEVSQKNQVIFMTCDERYTELLSGNMIDLDKIRSR